MVALCIDYGCGAKEVAIFTIGRGKDDACGDFGMEEVVVRM